MTQFNIEDDLHVISKNTIIRPTKSFHILGLTVSSNSSWKSPIQLIAKSDSANLGIIFKCCSA